MLINIGHENFIKRDLVAVILKPESSHVKKLRQDATEKGLLINATSGHKTRSVIVLTTGQVVLSSLQTTTFTARASKCQTKQPISGV
jgi:extracellular matrix regulatory protein A